MTTLTPTKARSFIIKALKLGEIPYIAGPPGIGKSDMVAQVADLFKLKLLDIRLSQMLPEDLTGIPQLNEKTNKADYIPFSTFPMENDNLPLDSDGNEMDGWLIFLDELSSANEEVMAAIYSILLGHRVGGKKIHKRALIIAAGNRSSDSAIARPLPDTLITRMLPITLKTTGREWNKWAKDSGNYNDHVCSFIDKYPDLLIETMDASKKEELQAYANPRGWSKVVKIINNYEQQTATDTITDKAGIPIKSVNTNGAKINNLTANLISACIGDITATSFKEHYNDAMTLPFDWDIAQSPSSTPVPTSEVGKAKVATSLAKYYIENDDDIRENISIYINRMYSESRTLFLKNIEDKLGKTLSDEKLLKSIKERIHISSVKAELSESDEIPMEGELKVVGSKTQKVPF